MEMDKTQLQWLLVGIGVAVVVLIYLWGIRSRIREGIRNRRRRPEREPALGETPSPFVDGDADRYNFSEIGITREHHLAEQALVDVEIRPIHREPTPPLLTENTDPPEPYPSSYLDSETPPGMTVILTVMAPRHQPFPGLRIRAVAEELNFQLNPGGLFERFPDEDTGDASTPVFNLAHLREPGSFDSTTLHELKTPGLLLFMNLPGPLEGIQALNLLVLTADQWAQKLGGVICDERRNRMSNQALMHLRNEVSELERRLRAWTQPLH